MSLWFFFHGFILRKEWTDFITQKSCNENSRKTTGRACKENNYGESPNARPATVNIFRIITSTELIKNKIVPISSKIILSEVGSYRYDTQSLHD